MTDIGNHRPAAWSAGRDGASVEPRGGQTGFSVGAFALSIIFVVLLIAAPEQLDAAWQWIRDLPLLLEIVAWIALLPWMLAYLAWQTSWDLWLRLVAVAVLVGGFAMSFWKSNSR